MSADNWATCPRCAARRDSYLAEREASVADLYGTVSVEEFDAARAALAEAKTDPLTPSFREDYEFYGADEGEIVAVYSGSCKACGLSAKFRHVHPLDFRDES